MVFLTDCEVCAFVADLNDFDLLLSKSPSLCSPCSMWCSSQTGFILWNVPMLLIVCFVFWWRQNNCFSTGCFLQKKNTPGESCVEPWLLLCPGAWGASSCCSRGASPSSSWHCPFLPICGWQEHQVSSLWWVKWCSYCWEQEKRMLPCDSQGHLMCALCAEKW